MSNFTFEFYNFKTDLEKFKFKFDGYEKLSSCYGESAQDLFVITVLKGKTDGNYLELGSREPIQQSNTYMLERDFDWKGISFDIDETYFKKFNKVRKNITYLQDATTIKFDKFNITHFDYISLDIDCPDNAFLALTNILKQNITFSVLTFEHDAHKGQTGIKVREKVKELLSKINCKRIVKGGLTTKVDHEDWFVNSKYVDINWAYKLEYDLNWLVDIRRSSGVKHFFYY